MRSRLRLFTRSNCGATFLRNRHSRFSAWLFSAFAALALSLAGIGMYGVVAYVTASRRREYGIRLSLGARPAGLFQLASVQNLMPVLAGISFGVLGSYWSGKMDCLAPV